MSNSFFNIAVAVPKYGLVGGGEQFVMQLTERLIKNERYRIHVFANKWRSESEQVIFHKIPIIRFPKYLTTISFAYFVNKKIARLNLPIDLIHAHDRIFHADLVSLHSIPHTLWVSEVRQKKMMSLFDRSTAWVEKYQITHDSNCRYQAVSQLTKEYFLKEFPLMNPQNIEVIHPAVNSEPFDKLDRKSCRIAIRRKFGLKESDVILLFVGMNFEVKGLDDIIAGLASVRDIYPELKLLVVGKGNLTKYQKLANDSGLSNRVIFAGVWEKEIEKIYLACDLFSMLSTFDTFGMTVLEAMSAGLPVIISNYVGAKDLIQNGINGFVVDRHDIDALVSNLSGLMNFDLRQQISARAKLTAKQYDWKRVADKVSDVYDSILKQKQKC